MTPLDFITEAHTNDYNAPAGKVGEALKKRIKICSSSTEEWEILSYYMDDSGRMVLDIGRKISKRKVQVENRKVNKMLKDFGLFIEIPHDQN